MYVKVGILCSYGKTMHDRNVESILSFKNKLKYVIKQTPAYEAYEAMLHRHVCV